MEPFYGFGFLVSELKQSICSHVAFSQKQRVTKFVEEHLHVATNVYLMMCRMISWYSLEQGPGLVTAMTGAQSHVEPPGISVSCIQLTGWSMSVVCQQATLGCFTNNMAPILRLIPGC